ncbi:MAG: flagellar protein FlaG [Acidobacteriota bacterium]
MDMKMREIQPVAAEPWTMPEYKNGKESEAIPPVGKTEGGTTRKLGEDAEVDKKGEESKSELAPEDMKDLAEEVQSYLEDLNIDLNFKVTDKTGDLVVKVLNRETGDTIRQIPPEDLVKLREKLQELRGVLFDGKV